MQELNKTEPFYELAQLFIDLQGIVHRSNNPDWTFSDITDEEWQLYKYRDLKIAYALLKEDEDIAISVANIIKTVTGK